MSLSSQNSSFMQLVEEAFLLLEVANRLEEGGNDDSTRAQRLVEASSKYYEAVYFMKRLVNQMPASSLSEDESKTKNLLLEKIDHYQNHAQSLLKNIGDAENNQHEANHMHNPSCADEKTVFTGTLRSSPCDAGLLSEENKDTLTESATLANKFLARAVDLDEQDRRSEAIAAYTASAGHFLQTIQMIVQGGDVASNLDGNALKRKLERIIDRVEQLKKAKGTRTEKKQVLHGKLVRAPSFQGYKVATL